MSGLAYLGQVTEIFPIENADRIQQAQVVCGEGGKWLGVVGKGDFSPGDLAVVYLPDAIVKPSEELSFLAKSNWRVRPQRFRGVPSECVIVKCGFSGSVGDDLTETLGVKKYEKALPPHMNGTVVGQFPAGIPRTDEPNFQSARKLVSALQGQPWYATEKEDGMSTTTYRRGEHFGVCSRNLELAEWKNNNAQWSIALKYGLKEKLPDGLALQFETVGPGVQKNPLGLAELDARAFQCWAIYEGRYLDRDELDDLCGILSFPLAPIVDRGLEFDFDDEALRKLAEGTYPNGKPREGIVIRPRRETWVGNQRLSFKVINLLYNN